MTVVGHVIVTLDGSDYGKGTFIVADELVDRPTAEELLQVLQTTPFYRNLHVAEVHITEEHTWNNNTTASKPGPAPTQSSSTDVKPSKSGPTRATT